MSKFGKMLQLFCAVLALVGILSCGGPADKSAGPGKEPQVRKKIQIREPHEKSRATYTVLLHFALSPDGKTVACVMNDSSIKLWDVASGEQTSSFKGPIAVKALSFSPDSKTLALAPHSETVKIWEMPSGKEKGIIEDQSIYPTSLVFSSDGKLLAVARTKAITGEPSIVKLWDVATGKPTVELKGHTDSVNAVVITPDNRTAITASDDKTVKLWDVANGKEKATLTVEDKMVHVAVSHDGKTAASGGYGPNIILLDVPDQKLITMLSARLRDGRFLPVKSSAFSPDGTILAAGAGEGVILFDMSKAGREENPVRLRLEAGAASNVAYTPDGKILVATDGHSLTFWDMPTKGK